MKTSKTHLKQLPNRKKGSLLFLVALFSTAVAVILATSMKLGVTEKKINNRHVLRLEARTASSAMVEYAFADVMKRFKDNSAIGLVKSSLVSNPVDISTQMDSFFAGSAFDATQDELIVGEIPDAATKVYINDPEDVLNGKYAYVRRIEILAKAVAASDASGGIEIPSYTREILEVRDAPLFANAIFYNMDLELHPGPNMNLYGPVHSNTDAWLQGVSSITFHESVTAGGNIYHGYKRNGKHTQKGSVRFRNANGTFKDMYIGGSKTSDAGWLDSKDDTWVEDSKERWDGYVKDQAHGVKPHNPVGIDDYKPLDMSIPEGDPIDATDPGSPLNLIENHAYALIEPVLNEDHPNYKGADIRKEKFAFKAGLLFKVTGNGRSATNHEDESTFVSNTYQVRAYKYVRNSDGDPIIDSTTKLPKMVEVKMPAGLIGDADDTLRDIENNGVFESYATTDGGSVRSGRVTQGMYDHREDKALDMLTLDIKRLRELVDDTDPDYVSYSNGANPWKSHAGPGTAPTDEFDPESDWNGIVYVEFPTEQDPTSTVDDSGRVDNVVRGRDAYAALQIVDAAYDNSTGKGGAPRPTTTTIKGLSLATNAPLYTVGHVNANGNPHSNDANTLDNNTEPPMAIASDTVSVLSEHWYPEYDLADSSNKGNNRRRSNENSTGNRQAKLHTEFAAAILTGLKPTVPDSAHAANKPSAGASSGGAHNFPRFLEKWRKPLTIRGSLVALFESEVHRKAMPNNFGHYYSPPTRDWGFNDNFRNGNYPPGTPNTRDYNRYSYEDLPENTVGSVGDYNYQEGFVQAKARITAP